MKKKTLFLLLTLALLLCLLPAMTSADASGKCGDDLYWSFDSATGTLTITGSGAMYNYYSEWPSVLSITSISLPDGLTSIGEQAFYCFRYLTSVTIPASVVSIGTRAFERCSHLTSVTIGNSVTDIGEYAFCYCSSLTSITIPDSVTSIGDDAFFLCDGLTSVTIGNGVTRIGFSAFIGCTGLKSIVIPDSVTIIEPFAFGECTGLTSIQVAPSNPNYVSIDGVLFSKDKTKLVSYPGGKQGSYTIPDSVINIEGGAFRGTGLTSIFIPNSVTSIPSHAFRESSGLTSVTIGNSVTEIGQYAFYECKGLTSITIPVSVTSIVNDAFGGCTRLTDVYYAGTAEKRAQISIENRNSYLLNATWHYNSTGPGTWSNLDALMGTNPKAYNNELAKIAAKLSLKTYDNGGGNDDSVRGYLTYDLGFNEEHHAKFFCNNYGGGSLAYTVATRDYDGSGADKLLVIVCQGSTNLYELIKDATAGNKSTYKGYQVYDIVHDFYADIVETGLPKVVESGKKYKVLLTGHSLGGAAANLVGAVMTGGGAIMTDAGPIAPDVAANRNDIFCYTFGSVNCIRSDYRIETGYENIHNVYNWLDTFSPKQYGGWLATGMGNGKGKFGRLEAFSHEYRDILTILLVTDPAKQIVSHVNHDMDKYLDAVKKGYVSGSVTVDGETDLVDTYAVIACPVDIEIVNSGQVVARVVDNHVETTVSSIIIWTQGDVKYVMFPSNEQFDIKIISTGDGLMDYCVERFHGDQVTHSKFSAVQLVEGKTMTSEVGGSVSTSDVKLYVVDDMGEPISEVQEDGTELELQKCGDTLYWSFDASDGTLTITGSGDMWDYSYTKETPWHSSKADITAVILPDGLTGIGSYAFLNCINLQSVVIPSKVTRVGDSAFMDCDGLTSLEIQGATTILDANSIRSCDSLTKVTVPCSIVINSRTAFWGSYSIQEVHITKGTGIMSDLHEMLDWAFETYDGSNTEYKEYSLAVVIDKGVQNISEQAFIGLTGLTSLTIPVSITEIGTDAFSGCSGLQTVNYTGTEAQQAEIDIRSGNDSLINAVWNYVEEPAPTPKSIKGLTLVKEPVDRQVRNGKKATFTVKTKGKPTAIQWYYRKNETAKWTKVKGGTKAKLTVIGSKTNGGYQYRCLLKNKYGKLYSNVVTLTVELHPPVIESQPEDQKVHVGDSAEFTFAVAGEKLTYKWSYRKTPTGKWTAVKSGGAKATLTVVGKVANDGYQYKCVVTNADGKVTSNVVTLDVEYHLPEITVQPTVAKKVKKNAQVVLTVEAEDFYEEGLTYQWYYRKSSSAKWTKVKNGTEATYTFKATTKLNGYQYKCDVGNKDGKVSSKVVTLKVK